MMLHSITGLGGRRLVVKCVVDEFPEMLQGKFLERWPVLIIQLLEERELGRNYRSSGEWVFWQGQHSAVLETRNYDSKGEEVFSIAGPTKGRRGGRMERRKDSYFDSNQRCHYYTFYPESRGSFTGSDCRSFLQGLFLLLSFFSLSPWHKFLVMPN